MNFTSAELSTIRCGMESAAEFYRDIAKRVALTPRLKRQFEEQAKEADAIADKINQEVIECKAS